MPSESSLLDSFTVSKILAQHSAICWQKKIYENRDFLIENVWINLEKVVFCARKTWKKPRILLWNFGGRANTFISFF